MHRRGFAVVALSLLFATSGLAKSKTKNTLPAYVLQARTVAVLIDPDAGIEVSDPQANQAAQKDVEVALMNWGRFEPVMGSAAADLIVVVRRGHSRAVDETISDPRQNDRAGVINPTRDGVGVGAQQGRQPGLQGPAGDGPPRQSPQAQMEIGSTDDSFTVFQGGVERPLNAPPVWRYIAKDGLRAHTVPAVDEFRKALVEAEKAAAKKP